MRRHAKSKVRNALARVCCVWCAVSPEVVEQQSRHRREDEAADAGAADADAGRQRAPLLEVVADGDDRR